MKYIIDFIDGASKLAIDEWMAQNSVSSHEELSTEAKVYLVEVEQKPEATSIVESITIDENISNQLLSVIEILPASTGDQAEFNHDSEWWKTASMYDVDFEKESSTFTKRGERTTVYVVDSGVKIDHPEFEGTAVSNLFSFNDDFQDTNGHGTSIASVISGNAVGLTMSKVKSVKVFDNTKTTMTSDLVAAFDAILNDMVEHPESIAIVNMSWSIPKNEYIESKIEGLINAGAFVVASAGNSGTAIENVTPASMERVLTIGAYTPDFVPADFSNYTSSVKNTEAETNYGALDAWAPGVDIGCALLDDTIGSVSGTSIATAIVSACLAYNSNSLYSKEGFTAEIDLFLKAYTLNKKNMLTLEGKYSESINCIVAFISAPVASWKSGTASVARLVFADTDMRGFLSSSAYVSKIELDKELPSGLSLSNGWLVGRLTSPPETAETIKYVVTVTYDTGDTGTVFFTLLLAPAGAPANEIPLEFTQYAGRCSPDGGFYCSSINCSMYCPNCDPKSGNCPCDVVCN